MLINFSNSHLGHIPIATLMVILFPHFYLLQYPSLAHFPVFGFLPKQKFSCSSYVLYLLDSYV